MMLHAKVLTVTEQPRRRHIFGVERDSGIDKAIHSGPCLPESEDAQGLRYVRRQGGGFVVQSMTQDGCS